MLTVIVPIYNEEKYISHCIESIVAQDYPKDDLEVLLVDGMSTDRTREIVKQYTGQYSFIRLLDNVKRYVSFAMNIGIKAAKGDIVLRLDAHSFYPSDYFSVLTRRLEELGADNVGVMCKTDVLDKSPRSLAIREVLCNKFGVGNSTFRTGVSEVTEVDTVPFGCFRRDVFDKYGMYDERLVRNQDIELNKRIINGGGKIYIVPDTYCTYLARDTYYSLGKNNYANGRWNILTVYYTHNMRSLSLRHFIPLLFVLGLIVPTLVGIFWHPALWLTAFVLAVYLLAIGAVSAKLAVKKKLNFFHLVQSFLTLHFCYGLGSLQSLLCLPFIRR